jgi:hypothetical protein
MRSAGILAGICLARIDITLELLSNPDAGKDAAAPELRYARVPTPGFNKPLTND